jgi:hypothetical protein
MKKLMILTAGLILFIFGCTVESHTPERTGSLNLTFSKNDQYNDQYEATTIALEETNPISGIKTITPSVDMSVSTFDIYGTGPEGRSFSRLDVTSSMIRQMSLAPGEWTVTVNAKNNDGVIIGNGSVKAIINVGKITRARVFVCPVIGEGTLCLQVIWPPDIIRNPVIKAEIKPAGGPPQSLPFFLGCNQRTAFYCGSFQNGYYTLSIQLYDGDEMVWGTVEAVRIIAGYKTCKIYVLVKDMCRGGLMLFIKTDLQNPVDILFEGVRDIIFYGSDMTVSAFTSEPVDSYQWYLEGVLLEGETGPSITLGSLLEPGFYKLDLLVSRGPILSSEGFSFEVY